MKQRRINHHGNEITRFQLRVYEATKKIPRGRVTTYKILADYISAKGRLAACARLCPSAGQGAPARELDQESACSGKHSSCRAVGQALRRNPFAPKVPCHRVIASDLSAGGFKGGLTDALIRRKLNLLGKEGVKFIKGHLVNPALIYRFNPPQAD